MPPKHVWGPPTWTFLHTLVEKVHDNEFPRLQKDLYHFVWKICTTLPCPDCSQHASRFMTKTPREAWMTKQDMRSSLFILHNIVNKRNQKTIQKLNILETYNKKNIIHCYNDFIRVFHTKGNLNLLTDTFQRDMLVSKLKKWMSANIKAFM